MIIQNVIQNPSLKFRTIGEHIFKISQRREAEEKGEEAYQAYDDSHFDKGDKVSEDFGMCSGA